ncbi:MAG: ParB/RepB/Spo0J family partition protein [Firmicutes bacterium]|jgi:ParB family chromosome partitioning protein|nr:ParB/RepB/Spo0J family partition protein [Bacillota bacterium]
MRPEDAERVQELPIDQIRPNPYQPRKRFDDAKLAELAESIKAHGIVQPLVVRTAGEGYELVVGQRRLLAARMAGLSEVPVVVSDLEDAEMIQVALIENLQREDLNPMEEAESYQRLVTEFAMSQEELARVLGRSRPSIANTLRLLNLQPEVQEAVSRGTLSMGHARALLAIQDPALQVEACRHVIEKELSVRDTEELVRRVLASGQVAAKEAKQDKPKDPEIASLEERLRRVFGTQVRIIPGRKKGKIEIEYYNDDDLERILALVL